jgi:tRNA A-37 threonylcarbamoyl transferase component Bud32
MKGFTDTGSRPRVRLFIRVRESRIDLEAVPGAVAGGLMVVVPEEPIKADRGTVVLAWPPQGEQRIIVKVYGEMGVLNWVRKQFVGYRACREFHTLAFLRDAGVDCCEPLFWGTGSSRDLGLFEVVATREVAGAVTLQQRAAGLAPEERARAFEHVFEQLGRVHRAGVYHGAPFPSNVLLAGGRASPSAIVLADLEKSVRYGHDIRGSRMAMRDLVDLVQATGTCAGKGYARAGFVRYGLDAAAITRVLARARDYRSTKFRRYRGRAEFLARGVLSRTLHRRAALARSS